MIVRLASASLPGCVRELHSERPSLFQTLLPAGNGKSLSADFVQGAAKALMSKFTSFIGKSASGGILFRCWLVLKLFPVRRVRAGGKPQRRRRKWSSQEQPVAG